MLLKSLVNNHYVSFLKLFNVNLKPINVLSYFILSKGYGKIRTINTLMVLWSLRFELKHRQSKIKANAITNKKNICLIFSHEYQLKLVYIFISNTYMFINWATIWTYYKFV